MYIKGIENLKKINFSTDIFGQKATEITPLSFSLLGYLKR
jgi:hypothetical protein